MSTTLDRRELRPTKQKGKRVAVVVWKESAPALNIWVVEVIKPDGTTERYEVNRQLRSLDPDTLHVRKDGTALELAYATVITPGNESCTCEGAKHGYMCVHLDMTKAMRERGIL